MVDRGYSKVAVRWILKNYPRCQVDVKSSIYFLDLDLDLDTDSLESVRSDIYYKSMRTSKQMFFF